MRSSGATADIREARFGLISCRFDPSHSKPRADFSNTILCTADFRLSLMIV